jgi:hypothetical protein
MPHPWKERRRDAVLGQGRYAVITTAREALAAGMEIVSVHGGDVRISASEYRQQAIREGGPSYVNYEFALHVVDVCRLINATGHDDESLCWDDAIAKLRETHVEVVAAMRAEAAAKALEAIEPKGVR